MQFTPTPDCGETVAMTASEALVLEGALPLYVLKHPHSRIAIRALREAAKANEDREARMEEAAVARS